MLLSRRPTVLLALLAAAIVPYYVDLGGSSIWDANEAFYVETPREMMERGDYVIPTFNYELRLNKPILSYWIVAGFYQLFGVSVGVQRVPIALGAMVLIATAFFLARAAFSAPGHEARNGQPLATEAALWAAVGLAINPRLLMFARRIFIDIYISLFLGLTLLFFALAERHPQRRRLFLVLMYVAAGLGVLTKGPIAIVLPVLAFGVYLLWVRDLRRLKDMMIPAGGLIVAAIVVPWYAALYARHGWTYITSFLIGENVARYTEGLGVESARGPLFYLPVLVSDSFPWSMFLFAALAAWFADRRAQGAGSDTGHRLRTLLWVWIAVTVLFFTASAAKQDLYIFPIVPAVAALAGIAIVRSLSAGGHAAANTTLAISLIVSVVAAGVLYLVMSAPSVRGIQGTLLMGLVGLAGGLVSAALATARRARAGLIAIALTFTVLDWIFVVQVLPSFERYKPVPGFARTLTPRLAAGDIVATYDEALPSLVYYLRRHVDQLFAPAQVAERFRSGRGVYVVLSAANYRDVAPQLGVETCVIDRRPTFDVKLRNVLSDEPLPELLVITNRCGPR